MSEELFQRYEQELTFFRQLAGEFALKYPKVASRLSLDSAKESKDPHVERLIEAFALMAARVRLKIDDEFPEIVESLLSILYPHYLQPLPSAAVAQFQFDPGQSNPTEPHLLTKDSPLHSLSVDGEDCSFRTCYPVEVWPLRVRDASMRSAPGSGTSGLSSDISSVLRISLETTGAVDLASLSVKKLRFFLNGDSSAHHLLYESLFSQVAAIRLEGVDGGAPTVSLSVEDLLPVGFGRDEGLLPYPKESFLGYRLLQEYFHFPQKFFFFDIAGVDLARLGSSGNAFDVVILFRDSELRDQIPAIRQAVREDTFLLGCTPIVNLFERKAETIRASHMVTEHLVVADRHRQNSTEVYSVDRVTSTTGYEEGEESRVYEKFYSHKHSYGSEDSQCFWYAHRRPSMRKGDDGTDVFLSLVDLDFRPTQPPSELVTVSVTCTNRNFVPRVNFRKAWKELALEGQSLIQARCAVLPIRAVRSAMRNSLQWRLVSHLSLNHLSIVQGGGRESLQEILRLYSFREDEDVRKRISSITGLRSETSVSRVNFEGGLAFCRGLDVEIEFDEEQFAGSGAFLLAAVLDRFMGLYSAVNSFSRLTARSRQRRMPIKKFPARAGEQRLL